ncbi:lysophospholipid acyltransferase family protein [uncultured Pelagimonas sp.]|uniref:lysophospholipid acyltransferase family protein n=1 Tax=uncultured Pelagimonas sp. TaxID=1618102 RepID=UPI00263327C8|nr:lysophospholipid acyltransferase family protein [uncultured Pelagimonas sp.]
MAKSIKAKRQHGGWQDWIADRAIRSLIWIALQFPIRTRLKLVSWTVRRCISPLAGWHRRIYANLDYVWPDCPKDKQARIAEDVIDNVARAFIENYDIPEMMERSAKAFVSGPGLAAIEQAKADGRPVMFVMAHFGATECARCSLLARGFQIGGLVRPMSNPYFNKHYVQNMRDICEPVFEQGRKGTLGLIKHIKKGGMAVLLFDVYDSSAPVIDFLGKPAPTMTSAAEIALRTDALLVPVFGIRREGGYHFDTVVEEPIPHGEPIDMMREATRRLEARIDENPGQWMWIHRRWKPERQARRQRKRAAATMSP